MIFIALIEPIQLALKIKVNVFLTSPFEHVLYSIFGVACEQVKILCKTWMGSIFLSGLRDQNFGKMGLRDQNNGKKIGINGSRIYYVTTL